MTDELTLFLKIKGLFIKRDELRYIEFKIVEECERMPRRLGRFPIVQGGLHSDDIAVALVLAKRIGAKESFDFGWAQEYYSNHFNLGFSYTEKGNQLMKMYADYNIAVMRSVQKSENIELLVPR